MVNHYFHKNVEYLKYNRKDLTINKFQDLFFLATDVKQLKTKNTQLLFKTV